MKKLCLFLAVLMIAALALSSCGGGGTATPTADQTPGATTGDDKPTVETPTVAPLAEGYDNSAVTIVFYHTMGQNLQEPLNQALEEFKELYPNITVDHRPVGGYDDVRDQIEKDILTGAQPNIAYCYPDHVASYNKAGVVRTLDDLIASKAEVSKADGTTEPMGLSDEQIADFIEGYYAEGREFGDGYMYTMPFSKSTEVLYYNKTFFEQNNLALPTTWNDLYDLCKKIKEIDPSCVPLGYDSEANWFITLCEQYESPYTSATGDHFLFNNERNRSFAEELNKWYAEGLVTTQALYGAYTSGVFVQQKSYMSIGSSAGATHQRPEKVDGAYPFEVGIASIPQVNPEKPKAISQGPSVCIFKKDNKQEEYASWLLVKFLTTTISFQADFARASGYIPVIKSVNTDQLFKNFLDKADGGDYIAALSMKVSLEQEKAYYTSPAFVGSSIARDEVGALLTKCLTFTGSDIAGQIETAFEEAIDECEYRA